MQDTCSHDYQAALLDAGCIQQIQPAEPLLQKSKRYLSGNSLLGVALVVPLPGGEASNCVFVGRHKPRQQQISRVAKGVAIAAFLCCFLEKRAIMDRTAESNKHICEPVCMSLAGSVTKLLPIKVCLRRFTRCINLLMLLTTQPVAPF